MSYSSRFVDSLDALVRLCAEQPGACEEEQRLLGEAVRAIAAGEITVIAGPTWPLLNGVPMDGAATAPGGLVARLWARGTQQLFVARNAEAADLIILARAVAGVSTGQPEGAESRLRTVRLVPVAVDGMEPGQSLDSSVPPLPADQCPFEPAAREPTASSCMSVVPFETVVGDGGASGSWQRIAPMINTPVLLRTIVEHDRCDLPDRELMKQLSALDRLPDWRRVPELSLILEELGRRAEAALRAVDTPLLLDIILAVLRGAHGETQPEARLAYRQARRRLMARPYLRLLVPMVPRFPERRDDLIHLLGQAGEEAADVLIDELAAADSASDRRAYIGTLVRLKAGGGTLLHMLRDERWFVVRNAADLLGEMQTKGAEGPLSDVLRHADERVRSAALSALGRLGTPGAMLAVQRALASPYAPLRVQAASVLASSNWPYTVSAVRRRLRVEEDSQVRLALVAALGRVASDEAVEVLTELTESEPLRMLLRRPTPLRSAAIRSLADANTPAARAVVARLSDSRSGELREAARLAMKSRPD